MKKPIDYKNNFAAYQLIWSFFATAVVTVCFVLIEVFITKSLDGIKDFWLGFVSFIRIGYGYVSSALVTSILTIVLHVLIYTIHLDNREKKNINLGIDFSLTPFFLIGLFLYIIIYIAYQQNYESIFFIVFFFLANIIFIFFVVKFWIKKT